MTRSVVSQGIAEVTATVLEGRSVLSRLVHASPLRVQPMPTAAAQRAGAAAAVIASVGGGLLGDDDVSVTVSVDSDATLWIGTQSTTKVYKKRRRPFWTGRPSSKTRVRVEASVAPGGLLVWAPDPTVPYRCSSFASTSVFEIGSGGSLVSVDWMQAGRSRMSGGERWVFDSYTSRTAWVMQGSRIVDAVELDGNSRHSFDINGPRETAATVAVAGPRAAAVAARLRAAAIDMAQRTGARVAGNVVEPIELSAHVTLGVSTVGDFALARLVAADTEDVYRLLRHCLSPLSQYLGLAPYADRVYAAPSPPPPLYVDRDDDICLDLAPPQGDVDQAADALAWLPSVLQLADSALPTGGFAHSGGLEAASQLGLLRKNDERALLAFLAAASKNHASLYVRLHVDSTTHRRRRRHPSLRQLPSLTPSSPISTPPSMSISKRTRPLGSPHAARRQRSSGLPTFWACLSTLSTVRSLLARSLLPSSFPGVLLLSSSHTLRRGTPARQPSDSGCSARYAPWHSNLKYSHTRRDTCSRSMGRWIRPRLRPTHRS